MEQVQSTKFYLLWTAERRSVGAVVTEGIVNQQLHGTWLWDAVQRKDFTDFEMQKNINKLKSFHLQSINVAREHEYG